ncbi:MAG: hypothetical protein ACI4NM_07810 [Bullifex sp.]
MKKHYPKVCAITGVAAAVTVILSPVSLILSLIGLISGSSERKTEPSAFVLGTIGTILSVISLTVLYCIFRSVMMF